eukprot:TRINITY_DN9825_c0_g1_i1.p1 TRINITY_DN9825_c0_g1~~TRINITY_DN9825_c0_g1_i1.p1  ORF type:complete len:235 (+),score=61.76 TRINITY_DN9825_c0_g1_i1:59-706(+)
MKEAVQREREKRLELERRAEALASGLTELQDRIESAQRGRIKRRERLAALESALDALEAAVGRVSTADDRPATYSPAQSKHATPASVMNRTNVASAVALELRASGQVARKLGPPEGLEQHFVGACTRAVANDVLVGKPPLTFLLREASQPGGYALSYVDESNAVKHCLVQKSKFGWRIEGETEAYERLTLLLEEYGFLTEQTDCSLTSIDSHLLS